RGRVREMSRRAPQGGSGLRSIRKLVPSGCDRLRCGASFWGTSVDRLQSGRHGGNCRRWVVFGCRSRRGQMQTAPASGATQFFGVVAFSAILTLDRVHKLSPRSANLLDCRRRALLAFLVESSDELLP